VSELRALLLYETILREFQKSLTDPRFGLEAALESGLGYLTSRLRLINVSLFWWDPLRNCLSMEYAIHAGTLLEGEEEVLIDQDNPLWKLVQERKPVVVSDRRPWVAYLPLTQDDIFVGAVRLERPTPLPRGKILETLPRYGSTVNEVGRDHPLLMDIADIISLKLHEINRDGSHRKKQLYLQAGTEVAAAVIETPVKSRIGAPRIRRE
jgi:hypothetical protein